MKKPLTRIVALHGSAAIETAQRLNRALVGIRGAGRLSFAAGRVAGASSEAWLDGSEGCRPQPGLPQLLNLGDLDLVRASQDLTQDPFWMSRRNPWNVLGKLWQGLQGAYLAGAGRELVLAGPKQLLILPFLPAADPESAQLHELAALTLAHAGAAHGLDAGSIAQALEALRGQWSHWPADDAPQTLGGRAA